MDLQKMLILSILNYHECFSVNVGTYTYAGLLASRDVQEIVNVDRLIVMNNSIITSSQYFCDVFGNYDAGANINFTNVDVDLTLKFTKDGSYCASILCGRDRGGITYNFENCLVDGVILGSGPSKIGAFVSGDKSSTVTMKNCVASLDVVSNTADIYLGHKSIKPTIESCYYISDRGNVPQNARFFEYNNSGDGKITKAVNGMRFLTEEEASKYSNLSIIFGTANGLVIYANSFIPAVG